MNKKITGVLIDTESKTAKIIKLEDSLDSYYQALHCTCIDIVDRLIGDNGKTYSVVCDDEGLLKEAPMVSAVSDAFEPMLVGSLLVTDFDLESGELMSLSDDDLHYVMGHVGYARNNSTGAMFPLLCHVGY